MNIAIILEVAGAIMFIGVFIYYRAQTPTWQKRSLKEIKLKAKLTHV